MKIQTTLFLPAAAVLPLLVSDAVAIDSSLDRTIAWTDGVVNAIAKPLIVTASAPPFGGDRLADPADLNTTGGLDLSGVARLFLDIDPAPGSGGACSGSLLEGGQFVLTAAHCVTNEQGDPAVLDGADGNTATFFTADGVIVAPFEASDITVHPQYNGDVRDGFDVAVIDLASVQPSGVARYELNDGSVNEVNAHLAAGYGQSGDGATGVTIGAGQLRSGLNNFLAAGLPVGQINNRQTQLTADFDSGSTADDAFAVFDQALFGQPVVDPFNSGIGFGADEVGIAPGDSGGPSFQLGSNGPVVTGVHSYGLRLELLNGVSSDVDGFLNSSFGEFTVDARVADPQVLAFIRSVAVPEPCALWLAALAGPVMARRHARISRIPAALV